MDEPSPEVEDFFNLCVRIYERMMQEGTWDAAAARMREERLAREAATKVEE